MKKRSFNAADVFIILFLVASVVGITVRAFGLADAKTEKYHEYRISFTARLDEKQIGAVSTGIILTDEKNTEFKLLEGYWITTEENTATLNGELLVSGRPTEKGFETSGGYYFSGDTAALKGDELEFEATVTDFIRQ